MTPDKRHKLRLWLFALDRFERKRFGKAGKARNNFIRQAADSYANGVDLPAHLLTAHQKKIASILSAHYQQVIPYFGQFTLQQVKSRRIERKAFDNFFLSLMSEWANRQALTHAKMIAATDRDDVMAAITKGLEEGLGTADIARAIRKASQLTPVRASTIARTETHQAATYASSQAAQQAEQDFGIRLMKEWLPTLDSRTRPDHAAMVNHPPIPLNEQFSVGGESMDRPGDPSASTENLVNCRCSIAFIEAE